MGKRYCADKQDKRNVLCGNSQVECINKQSPPEDPTWGVWVGGPHRYGSVKRKEE
jgi:hypothetical protein